MKKVDLKHIENVEGKYHLVFLEGRKTMECAKEDLRNAFFSLLLFGALLAGFVLIGGFNFFYIYFLLAFLVVFIAMITVFLLQKRKGKKKCVYAVSHSKNTEIVNKASVRKSSRAIVESMSSTIDKYEARKKYPGIVKKVIRRRRHAHKASEIADFERENKDV